MGNATSGDNGQPSDAFAQAARFKSELGEMQRALQSLQSSPSAPLLPHQRTIDGVIISCNPDVRVLVGPVVGKVAFDSARVLLEVDTRSTITCHISAINALTATMSELPQCRCTLTLEAQQPTVFVIKRLSPGREYRVSFSGIRQEDTAARRGSFRTPTLESGDSELRVIAVSGDDPSALQAGERSVWRSVRARVELKTVDCMLHLGGQVAMKRMFDYAALLLLQHGSSSSDGAIDWRGMEGRAVEVMREAYRTQWSLSKDVQFVLANASNLMMWSDADIYPEFTTRKEFYMDHDQPTMQMQVIRTVTRCARRLYHDYQRQLWDDDMEAVLEREAEMLSVAENALDSSGKIFKLSLQIPKVAQDLEVQKQRREIEGARRVEKQLRALEAEKLKLETQLVSFNQLLAPQRGEEFAYSVGAITVLFLDLRSGRLEPGGAQAADNSVLSPLQWEFIERALEEEGTRLLVVCMELPVADEGLGKLDGCKGGATAWGRNSEAQARLLASLFDWKLERPSREFVLLSGSGQHGALSAKTTIKDAKLRSESMQYVVSSITAGSYTETKALPLLGDVKSTLSSLRRRSEAVIHDRFQVDHGRINCGNKGFAVLTLQCGVDSSSPVIQSQQVHGSGDGDGSLPRVVLGPVVGWVDHHSAMILIEVDRDADVSCVVDSSLTGDRHRLFQRFKANRPNAFRLTRLRPEHYYHVSFSSIQRPSDFTASFTTVSLCPETFNIVAVCNDASLHSTDAVTTTTDSTLWPILADQTVDVPYNSIDLTLHLGGQFFPTTSSYVTEALRMAEELVQDGIDSSKTFDDQLPEVERIADKLRQVYRLGWTVSAVRQQLASGAHVFLVNENDLLPVSVASTSAGLVVQRLLRQVHREYVDLLLPPMKRRLGGVPRVIAHRFGVFGAFVLPAGSSEGGDKASFIEDSVWLELDAVLTDDKMEVLVLITTDPVVRESPTDTMEQARLREWHRNQFGFHQRDLDRLLGVLFKWQQPSQSATDHIVNSSVSTTARRVVLVSGDHCQSFDSVIQQSNSSARVVPVAMTEDASTQEVQHSEINMSSIRQFVVGPMFAALSTESTSNESPRPLVFLEGSFFSKYVYKHSLVLCRLEDATTGDDHSGPKRDDLPSVERVDKPSERPSRCQFLRLSLSAAGSSSIQTSRDCGHSVTCRFVCRDPVASRVQVGHESQGSSVCVMFDAIPSSSIDGASSTSILQMRLPQWLSEVILQPLTTEEEAQVAERADLLTVKADAISTTFEQSSELVTGLLTLSSDPRGFITELARLSTEFFNRLAGSAVQEKLEAPPTRFAVRLVLYRLLTVESDASTMLGAVDKAGFERLLTRIFLDGWMLSQRLTKLFIETTTTT